jgi:hypothetical protein
MSPRLLRPRAAGGFSNPTSISGLALWLDSDTATMGNTSSGAGGATNNGPVKFWGDKRGTAGLSLTNSGADSVCPTLIASGQNSRPHLSFDSGDTLSLASFSSTAAGTYFIAGRLGGGSQAFFQVGAINTHHSLLTQSNNVIARRNSNAGTDATGVGNALYSNFAIWTVEFSNSLSRWRANGATGAEVTVSTSLTDGSRIFFLGGLNATTFLLSGVISEVIAYDSVLPAARRALVEQYLGRKYNVTLAPQVSNADAQSWIDRVYANGGTVSTSTAAAVNTFCNDIDAAGIRDRFYRLNLFCGTGLTAALVPLYRGQSRTDPQFGNTTDTNVGPFVSGDYVETGSTGGLDGNGTTKYLNTGLAANSTAYGDRHLCVYEIAKSPNNFDISIGARSSSPATFFELTTGNPATTLIFRSSDNVGGANDTGYTAGAMVMGVHPSSHVGVVYKNGSSVATQSFSARSNSYAGNVFVFAGNSDGFVNDISDIRLGCYSIGLAMTAGQASAYYTAMQAFQTALGRNV